MKKKRNNKRIKIAKDKAESRAKRNDRLTNMYMIQFGFGILGILILVLFGSLYKSTASYTAMQSATWYMFGGFAILTGVLFVLGAKKGSTRLNNYGILTIVCTGVTLWLSLYNKIRPIMETVLRKISGNEALSVNTFWNYKLPIYAIIVYLIIAFIVLCFRTSKK